MQTSNLPPRALEKGLSDIALGKFEEVHGQAILMIRKDVTDAVPYCLLANIAAIHGNHFKACELYQKSVKLAPDVVHYHAFLGQTLTTIGQQNRAKKSADTAAGLICNNAFILDTIGVVYSRTGYHENAVPLFRKAVALDSSPANFHYNLAASLQFLGKFEAAKSAYQETLQRDPKAYRAWSSIVGLERQTESSNHLVELQSLFDQLKDDADGSLHIGHALAKTLEDLGRYTESLEWLHKAKHLKKLESDKPELTNNELFESAKSTLTASRASSNTLRNENMVASAPIFIIGMPRTGTTLVDRILSSHSQVNSAGELNIFPGLIKEACRTKSNTVMDAETFIQSQQIDLGEAGQAYLRDTADLARNAPNFTDKMPLNFFYAGLIHQALPDARIIALRRGAMDSCVSNYRQLLTVQHSYYHYTYDLIDIAKFYRSFDDLISHWRAHLPANRFMEVKYEDIVYDQENQTQKLLSFCGLEWEDACLRFHENAAPVSTASSVQVRQPLYSGSIERWKRYGDKLEPLQQALGELAEK